MIPNKLLIDNNIYDINFHNYDINIKPYELNINNNDNNNPEIHILDINNVYHYIDGRFCLTIILKSNDKLWLYSEASNIHIKVELSAINEIITDYISMHLIDGPSLLISYKDRLSLHSVVSNDLFHKPIVLYSQIDQPDHCNLYDFHSYHCQHIIQYQTTGTSSSSSSSRYNSRYHNKSMLIIRLSLVSKEISRRDDHIIEWLVINTKSLYNLFVTLFSSIINYNQINNYVDKSNNTLGNQYRLCRRGGISMTSSRASNNMFSNSNHTFYYQTIYLTDAKITEMFQNILESSIPGIVDYMNETYNLNNIIHPRSSSSHQMIDITYTLPTFICSHISSESSNSRSGDDTILSSSCCCCRSSCSSVTNMCPNVNFVVLDDQNTLYYYQNNSIRSHRRINNNDFLDTKKILDTSSTTFSMKIVMNSNSSSSSNYNHKNGILILQYHTTVLIFDIMHDFMILKEFSNIDCYLCDHIFDPFEYYLLFIPINIITSKKQQQPINDVASSDKNTNTDANLYDTDNSYNGCNLTNNTNTDANLYDTSSYNQGIILPQRMYQNYHNRKTQNLQLNVMNYNNLTMIADNDNNSNVNANNNLNNTIDKKNILKHWFVYELPFRHLIHHPPSINSNPIEQQLPYNNCNSIEQQQPYNNYNISSNIFNKYTINKMNSNPMGITTKHSCSSRSMCDRGIWREDQLQCIDGFMYCTMTTSIHLDALQKHLRKIHTNHCKNDMNPNNSNTNANNKINTNAINDLNTNTNEEERFNSRKRSLTAIDTSSLTNKKFATTNGTITTSLQEDKNNITTTTTTSKSQLSDLNIIKKLNKSSTIQNSINIESSLIKYLAQLKQSNQQIKDQIRRKEDMLSNCQKILSAKSLDRSLNPPPNSSLHNNKILPPVYYLNVIDQYYQYTSNLLKNQIIMISRIKNTSDVDTYYHITIHAVPSRYDTTTMYSKIIVSDQSLEQQQQCSIATRTGTIYSLAPQEEAWIQEKLSQLLTYSPHSPQYSYIASVACIERRSIDHTYNREYLSNEWLRSVVRYYLECKNTYPSSYIIAKPIEYVINYINNTTNNPSFMKKNDANYYKKDIILECWNYIIKEWTRAYYAAANKKFISIYSYQSKFNIHLPSSLTVVDYKSSIYDNEDFYKLLCNGLYSKYITIFSHLDKIDNNNNNNNNNNNVDNDNNNQNNNNNNNNNNNVDNDNNNQINNNNQNNNIEYKKILQTNPFFTTLDMMQAVDKLEIYQSNDIHDVISYINKDISQHLKYNTSYHNFITNNNINISNNNNNNCLKQELIYKTSKSLLYELQLFAYLSHHSHNSTNLHNSYNINNVNNNLNNNHNKVYVEIGKAKVELKYLKKVLTSQIDTDITISMLQSLFI